MSARDWPVFMMVLGLGCGSAAPAVSPDTSGPPAVEPPLPEPERRVELDPRIDALVARVNGWCMSTGDECVVYERPGMHPGRAAHGETGGTITDVREQLAELGHRLVWSGGGFELQAEQDIRLVASGNFSSDHIGPEAHDAVLRRIADRPEIHLDLWEARIVDIPEDPELAVQWLSSWHPETFLRLCKAREPARVARLAAELAAIYERLLGDASVWEHPVVHDPHRRDRMLERRAALRTISCDRPGCQ